MFGLTASMGHALMGPRMVQKREFSVCVANITNIIPGKSFSNPNFVNNHHPVIKNYQNTFDTYSEAKEPSNSSHVIIDKIKEKCPSVIPNTKEKEMCKSKRRGRSNKRRKTPRKNSKQNKNMQHIKDLMESETECDISRSVSDLNLNLKQNDDCYNDTEKPNDMKSQVEIHSSINSLPLSVRQPSLSESEDSFIIFDNAYDETDGDLCWSPYKCDRQRHSSICESEDSFIVFGDNEESDITQDSDSYEDEDDIDSSCSVIAKKKVRFAEDSKLCIVHPIIQWSYAYQAARKGPWEEYARDRERFHHRIFDVEKKLQHIFETEHREKIFKERFDEG